MRTVAFLLSNPRRRSSLGALRSTVYGVAAIALGFFVPVGPGMTRAAATGAGEQTARCPRRPPVPAGP
jgi:hypothetical protein